MAESLSVVYKVREYTAGQATKLVFFFCPFSVPSRLLTLPGMPIWHLRRAGYSVVAYSYGRDIATKSVEITLSNFIAIGKDVDRRIRKLDESVEIIAFGTSMGTVPAVNAAAKHGRIKKVILNLSYANISDHIVALPDMRTIPQKILSAYIASAGDEAGLRAALDPYSPLNLAGELHGKKVLLYSSRDDPILKDVHTVRFREALKEHEIELEHYENIRGGHFFAALYNYLRYTRYMRFLKSDKIS